MNKDGLTCCHVVILIEHQVGNNALLQFFLLQSLVNLVGDDLGHFDLYVCVRIPRRSQFTSHKVVSVTSEM